MPRPRCSSRPARSSCDAPQSAAFTPFWAALSGQDNLGVAPARDMAGGVAQWQSVQQAQGTTLRWGKSNYCEQDDSDLPLHSKCFQDD